MNIKPYDKTIRDLLGAKKQFIIPRFQREYSWDKKNYHEFFEDMVENLSITDGRITSNQYFLGTMLFVGNFSEGTEQEIQVVDGQQRLTTITILFSALSDRFNTLGKPTLSRQLFTYIMTKDDDGNEVRILKSKTNYPFFAYFIQDQSKSVPQEATTEEERCIKETYDYFLDHLNIDNLRLLLKRKLGSDFVDALTEVDILKALRDQVLNSTFVSISTTDREQANKIFEILNAKGKRLADIDLIKNKIFEILKKEEPADFAEESWKQIKSTLNSRTESVGLATFYRHYWISKYKKTYASQLYDAFTRTIHKTETSYMAFLNDMLTNATMYIQIVNPMREDYNSRKEYFWLVQSLNALNNYFNVVQVRIALLALFDVKEKGIIDSKAFKKAITYIENFHFAYTAIVSGKSNRLEKIYSTFAIELRKSENKLAANQIIDSKLYVPLERLFPSFEEFYKKFIALTYSKKSNPSNIKTKYAINKLNCLYSGKEIFEDDGSIEHLIPESEGEYALGIGNLILLEQQLNSDAGINTYEKKIEFYKKSNYTWIKNFYKENPTWSNIRINERAVDMAKNYYTKIFGREISKDLE